MKSLLPVHVVLVLLFILGWLSWAEQARGQPDGSERRLSAEILTPSADLSRPVLSPLVKQLQHVVSLKTSYLVTQQNTQRLADLLRDDPRILSARGTSSFLDGKLVGEGEIAHSTPDPRGMRTDADPQHRMLRFGLTGAQGPLRYGITYRSAGNAFVSLPDQATREVWAEWPVSVARVRTSRTETWNNLDHDPSRPRLTQVQERVLLSVAPPAWPEVSLSYARGVSSSSLEPAGVTPQRTQVDTMEAALAYTRGTWAARLASTYSVNSDRMRPGIDTVGTVHGLSGSYRPIPALTVAPSVSLRQEREEWSDVRIETPVAALSATYAPDKVWSLTTVGSYSKTRSTDGLIETSTFDARSVVSWTLQRSAPFRATLSFEAAYRNSLDAIHPGNSTEDLSGLMRVQLAGF